ncbi:hypothetical protein ACQB60_13965 [Actinomycetota bacterium Odt1-20B]
MPETMSRLAGTPPLPRSPAPRFRGRISDSGDGFYPAPHRYELFLSEGCPCSRRISLALGLLGLPRSVRLTRLARPADTPHAHAALRDAYAASAYGYDGPLTTPVLLDRWSGRIVSNHTPDILRDLAGPLRGHDGLASLPLYPRHPAGAVPHLRDLLDRGVSPSARSAAAPAC